MIERDYYQVLGVVRDAEQAEIRAAYVRLVKRHHPDTLGYLPRRLHDVQHAYRCLSNVESRAEHDRLIARKERDHLSRQRSVRRRLDRYDRRHPQKPLPVRTGSRHRSYRRWRSLLVLAVCVAALTQLSPILAN